MKKRVLTGLLVASMVCSMAACNTDGSKSTDTDTTETADAGDSKSTAEFNPDTEEDAMSIKRKIWRCYSCFRYSAWSCRKITFQ